MGPAPKWKAAPTAPQAWPAPFGRELVQGDSVNPGRPKPTCAPHLRPGCDSRIRSRSPQRPASFMPSSCKDPVAALQAERQSQHAWERVYAEMKAGSPNLVKLPNGLIIPAVSLPQAAGVQPKRPTRRLAEAPVDEGLEFEFLHYVEAHLDGSQIPLSIHTVNDRLLAQWRRERQEPESSETSAVRLRRSLVDECSLNLIWIDGPGDDEINKADYVGWDPANSALALQTSSADDTWTDPARDSGEVKSFNMKNGLGYISSTKTGANIMFYQAALPGILSMCKLGGNHARRKDTWFKGQAVTYSSDNQGAKLQAKDIKFVKTLPQ